MRAILQAGFVRDLIPRNLAVTVSVGHCTNNSLNYKSVKLFAGCQWISTERKHLVENKCQLKALCDDQ